MIISLYNKLVEEFESQLNRTLSDQEKQFIQWMVTHEEKVKERDEHECR